MLPPNDVLLPSFHHCCSMNNAQIARHFLRICAHF